MIQNPAYRFAADIPLPVKRKGLFFISDKYKGAIWFNRNFALNFVFLYKIALPDDRPVFPNNSNIKPSKKL
jgi:hypothetical protein